MPSAPPTSFRLQPSRHRRIAALGGHLLAVLGWVLAGPPPVVLVAGLTALLASGLRTHRMPAPRRLVSDGAGLWQVRGAAPTAQGSARARLLPGVISITVCGRNGAAMVLFHDAFRDGDHARARRLLRHGPQGPPC